MQCKMPCRRASPRLSYPGCSPPSGAVKSCRPNRLYSPFAIQVSDAHAPSAHEIFGYAFTAYHPWSIDALSMHNLAAFRMQ